MHSYTFMDFGVGCGALTYDWPCSHLIPLRARIYNSICMVAMFLEILA
jgi:hypothetical protein